VPNVLIVGDTLRSPELRHEVPIGIGDPFLYAERNGTRSVMIGSLEIPRVRELEGLEIVAPEELGQDELVRQGMPREQLGLELMLRACRRFEIVEAVVPHTFPLQSADFLRANGIELTVDKTFFDGRRRVKNEAEIAGLRRAQRAAEAGMAVAAEMLRRADAAGEGGALTLDGEPLTSERLRVAIARAFIEHGTSADEFIVSHGPQAAIGHEMGSGQILAGETIVIDLWPRDAESACYADMTRTFVVGEVRDEVAEWHRLCLEALQRAIRETRPGVTGAELFNGTCDVFEAAGYPTQRTKEEGSVLAEGFFHSLGHGVGLEVHEEPGLGRMGVHELLAGDVVTVEPGLYRPGYGGCRLEDLLLVTEDGCENLTSFPYDLQP